MGIIKTAMLSGAAMYGVKQISREAGRRYSQQPPPQPYPQQDVRRAVSYGRNQSGSDYEYDEEYYEQRPPPPRNPRQRMLSDQPAYYEDADFGRDYDRQQQRRPRQPSEFREPVGEYYVPPQQRRAPPQYTESASDFYSNPQQRQRGYVEPDEVEEPAQPFSSSNGTRNALLGQAMQYAQTYGSSLVAGKADKREGDGSNVQEFISGFIGK